jgi:hypothetical protein
VLVVFKIHKLEEKQLAKVFGKVDTFWTYHSTNLGFLLRENSLLYSSNLPLGVPNWTVIYIITTTRSKDFFGAVVGD